MSRPCFVLVLLLCGYVQGMAQTPPGMLQEKKWTDSLPPKVRAFPNPFKNRVELEVKNFEPGAAGVEITNSTGIKVYAAQRLVTGNPDRIVLLLLLPRGVYYCVVKQKQKRAGVRLVVE
jgi:Secretion system C-terminal sorting domain